MKSEIVKLRRKIFKNLKSKALSIEGRSPELTSYLKDQKKFSKREFNLSSIEKLKERVQKSDLIYLGDFHTFDQNIRNVLRIIKYMIESNEKCIIALEMVNANFQLYIDAYLERHLTDLEFLDSIGYHDSWRFPWTHYKLIFELAKENNIKVIGLNTEGSLNHRDIFASELLSKNIDDYPDHKILTFYGELHLTKNKIPSLVKAMIPQIKDLIIHQNLDEVYWKLIEENQERGIISFSESEYCIISAPPWIKYESMIYWYENLCDDPEFDIHEYIIENGKKIFVDDTRDNFLLICGEIIDHLNLNIAEEELEDFNLYDHTNLEFVEEKITNLKNRSLSTFYQFLIETGQSFKLPASTTFYCSSYSMNRISYLAGIHIFHHFLQKSDIEALDVYNRKTKEDHFILCSLEAMFAFFFSKVINPHRKCDMYLDLIQKQNILESENDKSVIKTAIQVINGHDCTLLFKGKRLKYIQQSSLYVGHILGEYLYDHVLKASKKEIKCDMLTKSLHTSIDLFSFQKIKHQLLENQDFKNHRKIYF